MAEPCYGELDQRLAEAAVRAAPGLLAEAFSVARERVRDRLAERFAIALEQAALTTLATDSPGARRRLGGPPRVP